MTPSDWSKAVIERDWRCVDCGAIGPLHAHHIKPRSTHPELRYDVVNGVAVCPTCHWKRHRADAPPRSQAKKRGPHRKTLVRMLEHANAKIAKLESEIDRLRWINRR